MQKNTRPNNHNTGNGNALNNAKSLPDITTNKQATFRYPINQVGMGNVEMLVNLSSPTGTRYTLPAKIDVFVNLDDKDSKGIHMSRLYATTYKFFKTTDLTPQGIDGLLDELIETQRGLSSTAFLNIRFDYPIEHPALLSETSGMRHYPIALNIEKKRGESISFDLDFTLTYSSACPCSTALSQKYIHDQLEKSLSDDISFSKKDLMAWLKNQNVLSAIPHSQRSYAEIVLSFKELPKSLNLEDFIKEGEKVLKTTVQTSVKREDEQDFARINAENLMFCEDAVRLLHDHYIKNKMLESHTVSVSHQESLHAHDAIASIQHSH